VIIANPTALHLDVAIPAARAGCSILIEKPVSHSSEGLDELKAALQEGGGRLLVGFQFRYHPGLQKVVELLKLKEIGRPLSFRAQWGEYLPDWHPWEDYRKSYSARADLGGGVVLTLSHPLDYLRWLFGEVESVWAYTAHLSDLELQVEDMAEIGLSFENGPIGSVHLDYYQRPAVHRMAIVGTEGLIQWNNADGAARLFRASVDSWESFLLPSGFERNELFLAEMRHFISVARGEEPPACTLADGMQVMNLVQAVHESSRLQKQIFLNHHARA
jgi:predicted dehydrogenase